MQNEIIEKIKEHLPDYIQHKLTHNGKKYICPFCSSGNGKNKTSAFSFRGNFFKCFSCGKGGDILDLIGFLENINDFKDRIRFACDFFGIEDNKLTSSNLSKTKREQNEEQQQMDYTLFFLEANKNLCNTSYYRGISVETLNKYKIGYIEKWTHPKIKNNIKPTPRLIIPTSNYSYVARDTRQNIPTEQAQYTKLKVGSFNGFFNSNVITTSKEPIYIVEGELDALSIIDLGCIAIALGSVANTQKFIDFLKKIKTSKTLILALDNDDAGKRAYNTLSEALNRLKFQFFKFDIPNPYKDINEWLQSDKDVLGAKLINFRNEIQDKTDLKYQEKKNKHLTMLASNYLATFLDSIQSSAEVTPFLSTGFSRLDRALGGGIYSGLYVIGGISSLGKTTFVTQVGDNIAQKNTDILLFSLEMSKFEIIGKSISRLTAIISREIYKTTKKSNAYAYAKTYRNITNGQQWNAYTTEEKEIINNAISEYNTNIANKTYISEGIGNIGVKEIRETIKNHILLTGKKPIVIIDYLQILAPYNDRYSDKQNIDKNILELKRITRDYDIAIIGISSLNRASYHNKITMEAFKESGAIEYSSDVLIGLQFQNAGEKDIDINEAKNEIERKIELIILKNRNGITGSRINFLYNAMFNLFTED